MVKNEYKKTEQILMSIRIYHHHQHCREFAIRDYRFSITGLQILKDQYFQITNLKKQKRE